MPPLVPRYNLRHVNYMGLDYHLGRCLSDDYAIVRTSGLGSSNWPPFDRTHMSEFKWDTGFILDKLKGLSVNFAFGGYNIDIGERKGRSKR
ncbi:hypothetical protein M408DRAFT_291105 [Serendipita vermifera MAFF 305830]|uniref:Uncharacterized protein n=1 Tax=Serendipita vermifera MAFF 305830 TaxID=933852 RepID=A0A0C2WYB9_SERVB|nr:hypothetical protein M408DRAFT_291105 [Serendipita vermifera MAFF 305830]